MHLNYSYFLWLLYVYNIIITKIDAEDIELYKGMTFTKLE